MDDFYANGEPLANLPSDAKLVVLFRDPRAVINSVLQAPDEWQDNTMGKPDVVCGNMLKDWVALNRTSKHTQANVARL